MWSGILSIVVLIMVVIDSARFEFVGDSIWGGSITPIVFCGLCWFAFEKGLVNDAPDGWALFSFIGSLIFFLWLFIDGLRTLIWQIKYEYYKRFTFYFIGNLLTFINGCIFGVRAYKEGMDIKR